MRSALIAGVLLSLVGAFILIKGVSYTREETVLRVGSVEAKMQQKHQVPESIGGVALGAGIVLVILGLKKR